MEMDILHIRFALKHSAPTFRRRDLHVLSRATVSEFWGFKTQRHLGKQKSFLGTTFLVVFEANSEQIPAQRLGLSWYVDYQV